MDRQARCAKMIPQVLQFSWLDFSGDDALLCKARRQTWSLIPADYLSNYHDLI
jgi:hypothetical protein